MSNVHREMKSLFSILTKKFRCSQCEYLKSVPSLSQLLVTDPVIYLNDYFSIVFQLSITGLIRTKSRIDYEMVKQIKFNVTVTDTGLPQLTSSAQIYVKIININDNAPQFNESEYHLNVNENAMKRTSIGFVYAHDADEGN